MWKRIFLWSYIMLCIGAGFSIMGKNCVVAEKADTNVIGNIVSEPEQQTIVVPFWDTKENMHYESVNGTLEFMDNPKIYTIQMKKDGLLCLAFLVKKLDVYYPEIELKDINGKHIQDLKYVKEENKITSEFFPPIYLKAGTYNLEVKYYDEDYDEDYYEDFDEYYNEDYEGDQSFEQEPTEDTDSGNESTSIKHELKYEIRYSAVQEETSSNWNLKKTKFRSTKRKKMYYKKINIKKDGLLKVYAQTIGAIDRSYCGDNDQWFMPVYAVRDTQIHVNERICQFRIMENQPKIVFDEVESLDNADRGGHGSTGKQ